MAIRAAVRGSVFRLGMRCVEQLARVLPRRFPTVNSRTGRLDTMDATNFGRYESLAFGVGMVHSFANVGVVEGRRSLLLVDTTSARFAQQAWLAIRAQTSLPIRTIVYTHGHTDHVGGVDRFLQDALDRGDPRPEIWGHERIVARFERYERMPGWIAEINRRQFGFRAKPQSIPPRLVRPDRLYADTATLDLDGEPVELHHADAETDDATWVWLPDRRVALVGDLLLSSLPNTGNPNKVQRSTLGWATALEAIAARQPRHLIPGHLQSFSGDVCGEVLTETARALRYLHDAVVERLDAGRWPDDIVAERIPLPPDLQSRPYLRETYGCCEFVVRDVLRQYAGWWGGNPAQLFPVTREEAGAELTGLIGADRLRARVQELLAQDQPQLALHLAVTLTDSAGATDADRKLLAEVLDRMAKDAGSFIARNLYAQEANAARAGDSARATKPLPITSAAPNTVTEPSRSPKPVSSSPVNPAQRPYRNLAMRLVNGCGRMLWACGLKRRLDPDAILSAAKRRTGFAKFGDERFLEGLRRLCDSFERTADLNPLGMILVRERLVQYSINRLKLEDHFLKHPETADAPMRKPLFVIGLPRTGTTLLYNLLSQDPHCRPLMTWETLYPGPDPLLHGETVDPRRRLTRRSLRFIRGIMPQMKHIHPVDPDGREECTWLLNNTFMTPGFVMDGQVDDYLDWILAKTPAELLPVYRDYRRQFQMIGWGDTTDRHWITKSPLHLSGIGAMLEVFPDGCFVQTHREPANVIPSACSLVAVMWGKNSDAVDPHTLGPKVAGLMSQMLDHALAARQQSPERICDIRFGDLVKDPLGTVRLIYERFGYELSDEFQHRMERWMQDNPQHKHGVHRYSPEQFGLTSAGIDAQFGDYARLMGVGPRERVG